MVRAFIFLSRENVSPYFCPRRLASKCLLVSFVVYTTLRHGIGYIGYTEFPLFSKKKQVLGKLSTVELRFSEEQKQIGVPLPQQMRLTAGIRTAFLSTQQIKSNRHRALATIEEVVGYFFRLRLYYEGFKFLDALTPSPLATLFKNVLEVSMGKDFRALKGESRNSEK